MRFEVPDFPELPTDKEAIRRGCYFDPTLPIAFEKWCYENCRILSDDYHGHAGRRLTLLDWQRKVVYPLLGWRTKENRRRFKRCFIYVSRRQGKSILCSALSVFTALQSNRSEIVLLASTKQQAEIIYDRCYDFVDSNPKLKSQLWLRRNKLQIQQAKNSGLRRCNISVMAVNNSGIGASGFAPNMYIWDEYAETQKAAARLVYNKIQSAGADRPNSQKIFITTPQFDLSHIAHEKFQLCKSILKNDSDDLWTLPVIYEAPDNWREDVPGALRIACPAADQTVPMSEFLEDYEAIKGNPLEEARFETMNLGRWVGSPVQWIPFEHIRNSYSDLPESELHGLNAICAIDYGASWDLTAYVLIVEHKGHYHILPRFFIPEAVSGDKEKQDGVPYSSWAKNPAANLTLTPGNTVDASELINHIEQDARKFNITEVRYDQTRLEITRQQLAQKNFKTIGVSQSLTSMSPAFELTDRWIRDGKIRIPDNPILNWNFQNCLAERDRHENLKVKKSGERNRIDGVDAIALGLTHWLDKDIIPEGASYFHVI